MSCEPFEAFLLDESLDKPAGHDAHVAGCASCRALKSGHLAALRLEGLAPRRAKRVPLAVVSRRASIAAAVTLVVGGLAGLAWLESSPSAPPRAPVVAHDGPRDVRPAPVAVLEGPVPVAPLAPAVRVDEPADETWATLSGLRTALASDLSRDLRDDEVLARSFGALPKWVAPTKTYPLRGLGAAAPRLIYTSED